MARDQAAKLRQRAKPARLFPYWALLVLGGAKGPRTLALDLGREASKQGAGVFLLGEEPPAGEAVMLLPTGVKGEEDEAHLALLRGCDTWLVFFGRDPLGFRDCLDLLERTEDGRKRHLWVALADVPTDEAAVEVVRRFADLATRYGDITCDPIGWYLPDGSFRLADAFAPGWRAS